MKIYFFIFSLIASFCVCNAQTEDFKDATSLLKYRILSVEDMTCSISSYSSSDQIEGALKLPETIHYQGHEFKVIEIENSCFEACYNLTAIYIPQSIKTIGFGCFQCCNNLREVVLSEGLQSIGNYAFASCSSLQQISIPSTVQSIAKGSFYNCPKLKTVKLEGSESEISPIYIDSDTGTNFLYSNVENLYLSRPINLV